MSDVVIDASALVLLLIGRDDGAAALRSRVPALHMHAPHLIDAEVGNALRRHESAGEITGLEAETTLLLGGSLVRHRYPHAGGLARRAWLLRRNLSFYDALYVALAGSLDVPLLTADRRLAGAPGLTCEVTLV